MVARFVFQGHYTAVNGDQRKMIEVGIGHVTPTDAISRNAALANAIAKNSAPANTITHNAGSSANAPSNGSTPASGKDRQRLHGAGAVYITEPLVVAAIMNKYHKKVTDTLLQTMLSGLNSSMMGYAFEPQIAAVVTEKFGKRPGTYTPMGVLFTFHETYAYLKKLPVQLVAIYKDENGDWVASEAGFGFGPSVRMGYKAGSAKEVLEHLTAGGPTMFILPDNLHHADMVFVLKPMGFKKWIIVVVQAKFTVGKNDTPDSTVFDAAERAVEIEKFYKSISGKVCNCSLISESRLHGCFF